MLRVNRCRVERDAAIKAVASSARHKVKQRRRDQQTVEHIYAQDRDDRGKQLGAELLGGSKEELDKAEE